MFRAHGELSIHAGVIKIQAIFCKFGFGKLAVALSTSWHAAVALSIHGGGHIPMVAPVSGGVIPCRYTGTQTCLGDEIGAWA